ncbi:hypothetical protein BDR26DRAFT_852344 [Obelidium mucronatum]|nr:hypothetical protein BDR26DRAFT_852344 [Obelidium mucronatum]
MKTLVCMGQIKDLEGKLTEAQGELQTLRSLQGLAQLFSFNGIDSLGLQQQQLNQPPFQYSQSASDMFPPDFGLLTGMQQMSPAIPNSSPQTSSNINLPSENSIPKKPSANDLYGQPEVDFVRIALKSLPSLKESKYVDLLMDLFLLQCEATDKKWMVKSMLKMMNLRHKLLDSCNVMDRQKVLELLVIFSERNKNHMMHRNSMIHEGFTRFSSGAAAHKASQEAAAAGSSSSSASDNVRVKKEPSALQKKLDEQLLKIPSLRNAGALIRQLGDEIHATLESA